MKDQDGNEIVIPADTDETSRKTKKSKADSTETPAEAAGAMGAVTQQSKLKLLFVKLKRNKKYSIPGAVVLLLALSFAVPATRYAIAGTFVKQDYEVVVTDSFSGKLISSATVKLGGAEATTNSDGWARLRVKVGKQSLSVEKKYYKSATTSVTVPFSKGGKSEVKIEATGRQVPVTVVNKIGLKPVENITIKVLDTEAKTDENGEAIVVIPATADGPEATFSGEGFNTTTAKLKATEEKDGDNTVAITPAGKIFFLSKQSGKIDVVKTDLDGSGRETVLAGTGREEEAGTILLASRDWKYLALKARRTGDKPKLFLIDTASGQTSDMDEGNAEFTIVGWINHHFVYQVERHDVQLFESKKQAVKSFDAAAKKINTLEETEASGDGGSYIRNSFAWVVEIDDQVVFYKFWQGYKQFGSMTFPELVTKQSQVIRVAADKSARKVVHSFDHEGGAGYFTYNYSPLQSYQRSLYEPRELYFSLYANQNGDKYYELADDKVSQSEAAKQFFVNGKAYPNFLKSPGGSEVLWSESRDGKNNVFVGDKDADNEKLVGQLAEMTPYGWFTDDYLLLSSNGSELYILPRAGGTPLKISDYHRPAYSFGGYGGGYGGL